MIGLADNMNPALPDEIKARLPLADLHSSENAKVASQAIADKIPQLNSRLDRLMKSDGSKQQKYIALKKLGDEYCEPIAAVAACRKGCAHCCHIGVPVTQTEANLIAKNIGRRARKVPARKLAMIDDIGYHNPCPFLVDGACSIYEHRPLACRSHYNMDVDDLLCRLLPNKGLMVPVPYANVRALHNNYALIMREHAGDIRQFFTRAP